MHESFKKYTDDAKLDVPKEAMACGITRDTKLYTLTREELGRAWLEAVRAIDEKRRIDIDNGVTPVDFFGLMYKALSHEAMTRGYLTTENPAYGPGDQQAHRWKDGKYINDTPE